MQIYRVLSALFVLIIAACASAPEATQDQPNEIAEAPIETLYRDAELFVGYGTGVNGFEIQRSETDSLVAQLQREAEALQADLDLLLAKDQADSPRYTDLENQAFGIFDMWTQAGLDPDDLLSGAVSDPARMAQIETLKAIQAQQAELRLQRDQVRQQSDEVGFMLYRLADMISALTDDDFTDSDPGYFDPDAFGGADDWGDPDETLAIPFPEPIPDLSGEAVGGDMALGGACARNMFGDLLCSDGEVTFCELEKTAPASLAVTCETSTNQLLQSRVPIEGDEQALVRQVAIQLVGENWREAELSQRIGLCLRGVPFAPLDEDELMLFQPCSFTDPSAAAVYTAQRNGAQTIDTGRIGYHAPRQMVLAQPYLLELAIAPVRAGQAEQAIDQRLRASLGPGTLMPGAEAIDLQFESIDVSGVMIADLIGNGFRIAATTSPRQALLPDGTTVWQWQVEALEAGPKLLTFAVSELIDANGVQTPRSVKRIPFIVQVQTVEALLGPKEVTIDELFWDDDEFDFFVEVETNEEEVCKETPGRDPARHALILTNAAYRGSISTLALTHEDGARMATALQSVGFTVRHCRDLGRADSITALRRLGQDLLPLTQAGTQTTAFFYYSGHGASVAGNNYLLPVDLQGASNIDIEDGGVAFEDVFNRVSAQIASTSILVFDACRTVMDDQSKGMVPVYRPVKWAEGVLQAFATGPGQTAPDSGIYSQALSEIMTTLEAPANTVFRRVQTEVSNRSNGAQRPIYSDGTVGEEFYFIQSE